MSSKDDLVPSEYKYAWTPDSELTLPDFLKKVRRGASFEYYYNEWRQKCKPSMVQNNDGTKPVSCAPPSRNGDV